MKENTIIIIFLAFNIFMYALAFYLSISRQQKLTIYYILLAIQIILAAIHAGLPTSSGDPMGAGMAAAIRMLFFGSLQILAFITLTIILIARTKSPAVWITIAAIPVVYVCTALAVRISKYEKYALYPTGNCYPYYPCVLHYGYISNGNSSTNIPYSSSYPREWGRPSGSDYNCLYSAPDSIHIAWLSIVEKKFYSLSAPLPQEIIKRAMEKAYKERDRDDELPVRVYLIAGMAPYGGLAVWLQENNERTEIAWLQGEEADIDFSEFKHGEGSVEQYCELELRANNDIAYANLKENGLPGKEIFNHYMEKFNYRLVPEFEDENAELDHIEMMYYNGERSWWKSEDYKLNRMRGKPYKISVIWDVGKSHYQAYFWTDEKKIIDVFAEFYSDNPAKESELVVEVGAGNDIYKLFLRDDSVSVEILWDDLEIFVIENDYVFLRHNSTRTGNEWMF